MEVPRIITKKANILNDIDEEHIIDLLVKYVNSQSSSELDKNDGVKLLYDQMNLCVIFRTGKETVRTGKIMLFVSIIMTIFVFLQAIFLILSYMRPHA